MLINTLIQGRFLKNLCRSAILLALLPNILSAHALGLEGRFQSDYFDNLITSDHVYSGRETIDINDNTCTFTFERFEKKYNFLGKITKSFYYNPLWIQVTNAHCEIKEMQGVKILLVSTIDIARYFYSNNYSCKNWNSGQELEVKSGDTLTAVITGKREDVSPFNTFDIFLNGEIVISEYVCDGLDISASINPSYAFQIDHDELILNIVNMNSNRSSFLSRSKIYSTYHRVSF